MAVQVKFQLSEEIWNKVVVDAKESLKVIEEPSTEFIVEYASNKDYHNALIRFEGMVEYEELKYNPVV